VDDGWHREGCGIVHDGYNDFFWWLSGMKVVDMNDFVEVYRIAHVGLEGVGLSLFQEIW